MDKRLTLKLLLIVGISILLLIPLMMIYVQVAERQALQESVVANIARSSATAQNMIGPIVVVRYRENVTKTVIDGTTLKENTITEIVERTKSLPLRNLKIRGRIDVETRHRGIYSANLFHLMAQVEGKIEIPPNLGEDEEKLFPLEAPRAYLVMKVSDFRGIDNNPEVLISNMPHYFKVDKGELSIALGTIDLTQKTEYNLSFPLLLTGTDDFSIAPTADQTTIELSSTWPHPSFQGSFLPLQRQIGKEGFKANWHISHLARDFDRAVEGYESLTIKFVEPINVYLKAERAVKYGILFIVLTFAAFFLLEVIRRKSIHPLQYLMVGLALAIFFLLLIALSEHIDFLFAYVGSALACITLISVYLMGVFRNRREGMSFGIALALVYGILYGVLMSEDIALLLGSLVLFIALCIIMVSTRNINWYSINHRLGIDCQQT